MDLEEERIALFLDYENLAIGARDRLEGMRFDLRPVLDALAERGRVIARKAYADWSYFDEDRRMLTRSHVELIEIPQRMGASRKNSADIKLCVDALEMAFERDYVTTFVICTGDSDFTPLVHKLRELNKRCIGVGIKESTSKLLPPACDEFLYYEALEGVDVPAERRRRAQGRERPSAVGGTTRGARARARRGRGATRVDAAAGRGSARDPDRADGGGPRANRGRAGAGLVGEARALRKDPTFSEADHGFRAFGELLRHLADRNVIELSEGAAKGDPEVSLPSQGGETEAFDLLREVVADLGAQGHGAAVGSQEPRSQGAARLQREEVRVPRVPAVLPGRRHAGLRHARVGRRRRGLRRRDPVGTARRRSSARSRPDPSARSRARRPGRGGAARDGTRTPRCRPSRPTDRGTPRR